MKLWNFEKIFFRINILVTFIVFLILTPATKIIASWYPDDESVLWRFPLIVLAVSAALWFLVSLCLPYLFKWGFFEERRDQPREPIRPFWVRMIRMASPIAMLAVHLSILLFCVYCLVVFMNSDSMDHLFYNLP